MFNDECFLTHPHYLLSTTAILASWYVGKYTFNCTTWYIRSIFHLLWSVPGMVVPVALNNCNLNYPHLHRFVLSGRQHLPHQRGLQTLSVPELILMTYQHLGAPEYQHLHSGQSTAVCALVHIIIPTRYKETPYRWSARNASRSSHQSRDGYLYILL